MLAQRRRRWANINPALVLLMSQSVGRLGGSSGRDRAEKYVEGGHVGTAVLGQRAYRDRTLYVLKQKKREIMW